MISAPPISDATAWTTLPKQEAFLLDYAGVFEVLYGGAAGGGKSDALLVFQIVRRSKYPHSSGLFLRRHFTELTLEGAAIPRSHELLTGRATWNGERRAWTFPNRSVLQFGHMTDEKAKHRYQSSGWEDICFDELTHFQESMYLYMFSRARTKLPGCRAKVRGATNPGNIGHGWVKERFIDKLPAGRIGWYRRIKDADTEADPHDQMAKSRAFVPARLEDNRYLFDSGEYEATLEALPEDDYKALRLGDWDAWQGMVFKRFSRARHVLRPFEIPERCRRVAGLDWGTARPFVCLWAAYGERLMDDPPPLAACSHEHCYVYREFARPGLLDVEQAREVARLSKGETVRAWHADPNSFFLKSNATGQSPAGVFAEQGIRLVPSNNDRLPGKRAVDAALGDCACGVPRLRFFETCVGIVTTLPQLPYDPIKVEDVDTDAADDHYDGLRYLLMGPRPSKQGAETVAAEGLYA